MRQYKYKKKYIPTHIDLGEDKNLLATGGSSMSSTVRVWFHRRNLIDMQQSCENIRATAW